MQESRIIYTLAQGAIKCKLYGHKFIQIQINLGRGLHRNYNSAFNLFSPAFEKENKSSYDLLHSKFMAMLVPP